MEQLPTEVFMRILTSCKLKDLVQILPSVCKSWRDTILVSKSFHCLHYKVSEPQKCIVYFPKGYTNVHDKGLVCMCMCVDGEKRPLEVRNAVTNIGKIIPSPSPGFIPFDIRVDANSAFYTILAAREVQPTMFTEVFDSRENVWKEAATLHWDGPLQNELVGSVAMLNDRNDLVAAYDMKQDSWSMARLEFPDSAGFVYTVIPCEDKIILAFVAYETPHVKLWDLIIEDGVAKPRYMTEISGSAIAELVKSPDVRTHSTEWRSIFARRGDGTIDIAFYGGEIGKGCILLEYDLIRSSWRAVVIPVKTLMHSSYCIILFTPSLFSP